MASGETSGTSLTSETNTTNIVNSNESTTNQDATTNLIGTYFGVNGSILTLFSDGNADYYYSGMKEVDHDNSWSYDADSDKLNLVMSKSAFFGRYEIEAFIDDDVSSFNLVGKGELNSFSWDDEMYYKITSDVDSYTVNNCKKLIKGFTLDNPDIETNIKTNTFVPPKGDGTTETTSDPNKIELNAPAVFTVEGRLYEVKVQFIDGVENDSLGLYTPRDGYEYLVVTSVCNNLSDYDYFHSYLEFQCYAADFACSEAYLPFTFDSSINISAGRLGTIAFAYEVPKDVNRIELEFKDNNNIFSSKKTIISCK